VTVAHADLPRPWSLGQVAVERRIVLVPDRRRDGTNVMAFPMTSVIPAAYGAGSFRRHLAEAEVARTDGIQIEVRDDPDLSIDVDTRDDLENPLVKEMLPAWVRTIQASRGPA